MTALLVGESVSRHFGGLRAVDNVDFHVDEAEILGLIGPNGAGKTTTLRVISGIRPITRGDLRFEGESLLRVPAHRRPGMGIALVPRGKGAVAAADRAAARSSALLRAGPRRCGPPTACCRPAPGFISIRTPRSRRPRSPRRT